MKGRQSMARRTLNRKELRADYDAAERRQEDDEERDEAEEEDEEDGDEEDEGEADADAETDDAEGDGEDESEEAPKKRKAPAKAAKAPKAPKAAKPKSRSRAQKVVRLKVVWGVFNNSNQRVAVFDYPKRQDAYDLAAKLTADKKNTHFVQPVKEPMEEKKEAK